MAEVPQHMPALGDVSRFGWYKQVSMANVASLFLWCEVGAEVTLWREEMGGQSGLSASLSSPDCHQPNVVWSLTIPRGQLASRCLVFREQRERNSGIEKESSRPSFRDSNPSLQKSLPVQVTTPMCALLTERGTHQTNELPTPASVDFS